MAEILKLNTTHPPRVHDACRSFWLWVREQKSIGKSIFDGHESCRCLIGSLDSLLLAFGSQKEIVEQLQEGSTTWKVKIDESQVLSELAQGHR